MLCARLLSSRFYILIWFHFTSKMLCARLLSSRFYILIWFHFTSKMFCARLLPSRFYILIWFHFTSKMFCAHLLSSRFYILIWFHFTFHTSQGLDTHWSLVTRYLFIGAFWSFLNLVIIETHLSEATHKTYWMENGLYDNTWKKQKCGKLTNNKSPLCDPDTLRIGHFKIEKRTGIECVKLF